MDTGEGCSDETRSLLGSMNFGRHPSFLSSILLWNRYAVAERESHNHFTRFEVVCIDRQKASRSVSDANRNFDHSCTLCCTRGRRNPLRPMQDIQRAQQCPLTVRHYPKKKQKKIMKESPNRNKIAPHDSCQQGGKERKGKLMETITNRMSTAKVEKIVEENAKNSI